MLLTYRVSILSTILIALASTAMTLAFVPGGPGSAPGAVMNSSAARGGQSEPEAIQGSSDREGLEAEVISIKSGGFEPAQITRPTGPFLLVIDNRSGMNVNAFEIRHEDGSLRHSFQGRRRKLSWQQMLGLPPGRYLLRPAAYPSLSCRLNITTR